MKIWGEISKVFGVQTNNKKINKVEQTTKTESKKDVVSISESAKDYQTVMNAINKVPDVRQERVEEIKQKYESGDLNTGGEDIADKILDNIKNKKV